MDMMFLLCTSASCIFLKDNNGVRNYLDVVLVSCFMVVTSHDVFDFCWRSILIFSVFPIIWPLLKACIWLSICWSCSVLLGVVSRCLLLFSEEKFCGFGVELYGEKFLNFPFVLIFKIVRFGVMWNVPGFGGLFGCVFLRLAMWPLNLTKSILIKWSLDIYWNKELAICS